MPYAFEKETGLYLLDDVEPVVGDGKTLMVDLVVFVPVTADGDNLQLTDADDNVFVETKGLKNKPNPIAFSPPRKLNGLKVAVISSGKAYLYVAQR